MPFGWLYGILTSLRNKLYDRQILSTYRSTLRTIVIGNLQVGGSGKTPHTAMLYEMFKDHYRIGILSRGYGRKTKGLIVADRQSDALSIGDEPFWYHQTLKDAQVVVAENRKAGLQYFEKQNIDLVLLDDAFQHRSVTCTLNILLTDYMLPYYMDHVMPYGRLREWKTSDKRAHIIVVTKCPADLILEEKIKLIQAINPYDYQHVFFTAVKASKPYPLKGKIDFETINPDKIVVMSGIANPENFISTCSVFNKPLEPLSFNDHHHYTPSDIRQMINLMTSKSVVLVTEKDAAKLIKPELMELIPADKLFVLPIKLQFLFNEKEKFEVAVKKYLR